MMPNVVEFSTKPAAYYQMPVNTMARGGFTEPVRQYPLSSASQQQIPYTQPLQSVQSVRQASPMVWQNRAKALFHNREAIVYAFNIRNLGAGDFNQDGKITPQWESGTFLRTIEQIPRLKAMGINTVHILPILEVGQKDRLGEFGPYGMPPGSVYAPKTFHRLNPQFQDPRSPLSALAQAKAMVNAFHQAGINVIMDVPSCGATDFERPDLFARDHKGRLVTPTNWVDIRMLQQDSPQLRAYFQRFFDLMVNELNVDGFRCDVARARSLGFWQQFIRQYPEKVWLAESYGQEDATINNLPADHPESFLKIGFDAVYHQDHIFPEIDANRFMQYQVDFNQMVARTGLQKSKIASLYTHDDFAPIKKGGPWFCHVMSGLMATLPNSNPYIIHGYETGYYRKHNPKKEFDLPLFDYVADLKGTNPEIGDFLTQIFRLRQSPQYGPILTRGSFTPLAVQQNPRDPNVVAFLRQIGNRTLLIVANKDPNTREQVSIRIPGLSHQQQLVNLAPAYGDSSTLRADSDVLHADLGRASFQMFEILLPHQTPTSVQ